METNLQKAKTGNKATNYMLFIFGILIFSYTAIRAHLLSITWDEAYSYIEFVRNGIVFPQQYNTMSANNHLLYTWLEIQLVNWFGVSELILRIPSLFAHALFLFYSAKLVRNFNNNYLALASFFIINLNPYLLDFFSLARGYGLSLGLMIASIYYLYEFHMKGYKNKFAVASLFFAGLAVLANYVLLNYCLSLFGLMVLLMAYTIFISAETGKQKVFLFFKGIIFPTIILCLLLWIVVPIAFKLKESGALFFGGNKGFWQDTISTIINRSFYDRVYGNWFQRLVKGCMLLVIVAGSLFFVIQLFKKQTSGNKLFLGSLLFLIGTSAASTLIQHHFLGTLYLMDRTALFLLVLFNLIFVFLINELSEKRKKIAVIVYLSGIIVLIHFVLSFNLHYTLEWRSNADTKEMLSDLEKIKQIAKEKNNVSIGIPMAFDPGINFYRDINNLTWLNTVSGAEPTNRLHDYFYLSQEELATINKDSIEIIKTYSLTKNVLAKPKYKFRNVVICFNKKLSFENEPEQRYFIDSKTEYSRGFSYVINDSITPHKNAVIDFQANVMADEMKRCNLFIVISLQDIHGSYLWQSAYIKDYIKNEKEWVDVNFSCIVPQEVKQGDELSVYIWNQNKGELFVKKMNLKWIDYQF